MIALMLAFLAAAPVDEAVGLEEQAFVAADDKRYCEALALFMRANELAPNADLLFNAAQVAVAASDRERALILYAGLLTDYPDARRRAEVRKEMDALSARIEKDGAGAPCVTTAPAGVADSVVESRPVAPLTVEPPVVGPAAPPSLLPWGLVAGGTAGLVTGGALALVGVGPLLEYGAAAERVRSDQARGDLSRAVDDQAALRSAQTDWGTWGQTSSILGGVTVGVGALALGVGVALLTAAPPEAPTNPTTEAM